MPAAFALALIAFLLDFVPIIGPIAAAIPGILLGFTVSPQVGLATTALYIVIQQIESNLLQPLIQQRAVELPPALLLFALIESGSSSEFLRLAGCLERGDGRFACLGSGPAFIIAGVKARATWMVPMRLTSIRVRHFSSGIVSTLPQMEMPPTWWTVWAGPCC